MKYEEPRRFRVLARVPPYNYLCVGSYDTQEEAQAQAARHAEAKVIDAEADDGA